MEEKINPTIENKTIFKHPTSGDIFGSSGFIFILIGIFLGYLISSEKISFWVIFLLILILLIRIFYVILQSRLIIIDSELVKVTYKYLKKKSYELRLSDCIGYFCYCKNLSTFPFLRLGIGIILKFPNELLLKLKTNPEQKRKLDILLNILKNKQINNYTPQSKLQLYPDYPYIPPSNPFNYLNIEKYAQKKFNISKLSN